MQKAVRNDELTNIDIVLYALFRLGGYKHKVHTEEIAEIEIRDEDFGSFRPGGRVMLSDQEIKEADLAET